MKAIIQIDIPDHQIGQEVSIYFKDTMMIKGIVQETSDDAISRQIISDYVQSHIQEINTGYGDLNKHTNEILRMIVDYIESMSSVNPQEPNIDMESEQIKILQKRAYLEGFHEALKMLVKQEPKTEKVIKMRDATPEERESIEKYIKSISKLTGVNFWDLEQEPKTGHWISTETKGVRYAFWCRYKCSLCGGLSDCTNFCPNCGCRMVDPQESEEL